MFQSWDKVLARADRLELFVISYTLAGLWKNCKASLGSQMSIRLFSSLDSTL